MLRPILNIVNILYTWALLCTVYLHLNHRINVSQPSIIIANYNLFFIASYRYFSLVHFVRYLSSAYHYIRCFLCISSYNFRLVPGWLIQWYKRIQVLASILLLFGVPFPFVLQICQLIQMVQTVVPETDIQGFCLCWGQISAGAFLQQWALVCLTTDFHNLKYLVSTVVIRNQQLLSHYKYTKDAIKVIRIASIRVQYNVSFHSLGMSIFCW